MKQNRKGSRKGQDFTSQGIKNVANAFKDITTKKIPNAIGKLTKERDGSRKGRTITVEHGSYDVSDIDKFIAEGNIGKGVQNSMKNRVISYLMNEKGYSETDAWITYDVWAKHDNMVYGIANYEYEDTIEKYRSLVGLPPREGSRKGSVSGKGSRPENLGSIASKVALGRKRSINMDGEYVEQESREGSRRGDALAQQIIGDNVEEDSDGYNFYDARNALRLEGYSEDEIEDNIDTWMYQHMN